MKITQLPTKVLINRTIDVKLPLSEKDKRHIQDMIKHIDDSQEEDNEEKAGVGLAATQIGLNLKMLYVNVPLEGNKKNFRKFLINPKLVGESVAEIALAGGEGCLSINENKFKTEGYVVRKFKVILTGYSYFEKKMVKISQVGYPAIVLQHELDHLNGTLFIDKIDKKNPWSKKDGLILI